MARFTLFIFLLLLLYTSLHWLIKETLVRRKRLNRPTEPEELVQDPCCRTYILKGTAVRKRVAGRNYYFCSKDCVRKFLDETKSQSPKDRAQKLRE